MGARNLQVPFTVDLCTLDSFVAVDSFDSTIHAIALPFFSPSVANLTDVLG